jgi:hypothetical protein
VTIRCLGTAAATVRNWRLPASIMLMQYTSTACATCQLGFCTSSESCDFQASVSQHSQHMQACALAQLHFRPASHAAPWRHAVERVQKQRQPSARAAACCAVRPLCSAAAAEAGSSGGGDDGCGTGAGTAPYRPPASGLAVSMACCVAAATLEMASAGCSRMPKNGLMAAGPASASCVATACKPMQERVSRLSRLEFVSCDAAAQAAA